MRPPWWPAKVTDEQCRLLRGTEGRRLNLPLQRCLITESP